MCVFAVLSFNFCTYLKTLIMKRNTEALIPKVTMNKQDYI